jgi:hypothetical protein
MRIHIHSIYAKLGTGEDSQGSNTQSCSGRPQLVHRGCSRRLENGKPGRGQQWVTNVFGE